ncbi:MAG: hypothetical protein CVU13_10230 [Bacteroidetes bacterium HGW-Bacteroidetes-8]|jgi:hypothetical protein|nr:MAG: hypothetical protein CVU13_10230 [Bacteroidetes bacterium HGW-Bacteroidetes-8]
METDYKTREYKERYSRWQDAAITQLGYSNNLILLLATGLLGFVFEKKTYFKILNVFQSGIDWSTVLYIFAILSLFSSIMFGLLVTISRLYNFRIDRNIVLTRKRFHKTHNNSENKLPKFHAKSHLRNKKKCFVLFKLVLTKDLPTISDEEVADLNTVCPHCSKFSNLLEISYVLGILTWRYHKRQLFFFVISPILYFISILA